MPTIFVVAFLLWQALPAMARRAARRWAGVRAVAEYAHFSPRTIRARIADGSLPAYVPAGSRELRIDLADVDAWLEAERVPSAHVGDGTSLAASAAKPATRSRPRRSA